MNETVMQRPLAAGREPSAGRTRRKKSGDAKLGYLALAALLLAGWMLRDRQLVNPESGVGYWLGIVGGSLMLALLLYPLRKRVRFLHRLGATRHWFRMHMVFGVLGPLLVLYHCNFQLGSFNSKVALYCMLLVAGSGIVGRYFYARIHRGLYGRKTDLKELQEELRTSLEKGQGMVRLMPSLGEKLDRLANDLFGSDLTQSLGVGRSIRWTFTHHLMRLSLWWTARSELRAAARNSAAIEQDYKRLLKGTAAYIREYTHNVGRVAQFSFYERLFALWHVFHLPIFIMMILSALVHVVAVHMY